MTRLTGSLKVKGMRKRSSLLAGVAAAALVVALPSGAHAAPGDTWRPVTFLPISEINDFDAAGPAEVWHVGADYDVAKGEVPAIFQWTGGLSWKRYSPPGLPSNGGLTDVTARSSNEVWATGYTRTDDYFERGFTYLARYDQSGWSRVTPPQPAIDTFYREMASDSAGVWLAEHGRISRWDGTTWTTTTTLPYAVERIEAFGPDNAWVATSEEILHWNGSSWQAVALPEGVSARRILFTADGAWAATASGLHTWNGSSWQLTAFPAPFDGADLWIVNGLPDSDGQWVSLQIRGGESGLLRWDGSEWTGYPLMPDTARQVVIDEAGRIWGVNRISRTVYLPSPGSYNQYKGQVVRLKDGTWQSVGIGLGEADYKLVHLPESDRLYGVGENEWNGSDKVVTNH